MTDIKFGPLTRSISVSINNISSLSLKAAPPCARVSATVVVEFAELSPSIRNGVARSIRTGVCRTVSGKTASLTAMLADCFNLPMVMRNSTNTPSHWTGSYMTNWRGERLQSLLTTCQLAGSRKPDKWEQDNGWCWINAGSKAPSAAAVSAIIETQPESLRIQTIRQEVLQAVRDKCTLVITGEVKD